jgi:hypothetical protein
MGNGKSLRTNVGGKNSQRRFPSRGEGERVGVISRMGERKKCGKGAGDSQVR